jgi:hypothetical protein
MFQSTLTNRINGRNNDVPPEIISEADKPHSHNNLLKGAIMGSYNTQLLTKFGYYLSPKPTVQQLKK